MTTPNNKEIISLSDYYQGMKSESIARLQIKFQISLAVFATVGTFFGVYATFLENSNNGYFILLLLPIILFLLFSLHKQNEKWWDEVAKVTYFCQVGIWKKYKQDIEKLAKDDKLSPSGNGVSKIIRKIGNITSLMVFSSISALTLAFFDTGFNENYFAIAVFIFDIILVSLIIIDKLTNKDW